MTRCYKWQDVINDIKDVINDIKDVINDKMLPQAMFALFYNVLENS